MSTLVGLSEDGNPYEGSPGLSGGRANIHIFSALLEATAGVAPPVAVEAAQPAADAEALFSAEASLSWAC